MKNAGMFRAVCIGAFLFAAGSAHGAAMFAELDDTYTVNYDGNIGTQDVDGLTAQTTFTLNEFINTDEAKGFVFVVMFSNTTDSDIWQDARVSSIGFNVNPDVVGADASDPWTATLDNNPPNQFPNEVGRLEVCAFQPPGSCTGSGGGLDIGQSATFTLTLFFDPYLALPSTVTLSDFAVRYQSLTSQELGFSGASGTGRETENGGPITEIPEPGALALLGLGLVAMGWVTRRRHGLNPSS